MNERLAELQKLWNKNFDGELSPEESRQLADLMSDGTLMEAFSDAQASHASAESLSGLSESEWSSLDRRVMALFRRRRLGVWVKPLGLALMAGAAVAATAFWFESNSAIDRPNLSLEGGSFSTEKTAVRPQAEQAQDNRSHEIHADKITVLVTQAEAGKASVKILDASGTKIRRLYAGTMAPGKYHFQWNGLDDQGHKVTPGIYTIEVQNSAGIEKRQLAIRQKK